LVGGFEEVRIQILRLGQSNSSGGKGDQRAQNISPKITQNNFPKSHVRAVASKSDKTNDFKIG